MSDIEQWMRSVEQRLVEFDRRIRSKPSSDVSQGAPPSGPAGGSLTGTYPNPTLAAGSVTGGAGGAIADGTITDADVASANKDGAAGTASMRTLGTGAQQAVAGNDARLSNARTPLAHQHAGEDITSGTVATARLNVGTAAGTVAAGNHTHTLSAITGGGSLAPPLVMTTQASTPGSIPSGSTALYFKPDGYAYTVTSAGVERPLIPKPDQLHQNASLDNVTATTSGGGSSVVVSHDAPTGWSWFWSTSGYYWESDETVTLYGLGKSAKMVMGSTATQSNLLSSIFAVTAGSLVTVSAWVRGTASSANPAPRAFITLYTSTPSSDPDFFQPAGTVAGVDTAVVQTSTTWQKITTSFVVPAGHTKCRFMLRADTGGGSGLQTGTVWWDETESTLAQQPPAQVSPGTIVMWPTATAPSGYLACAGGTFDSGTYPTLAGILGDLYGTHSGTTYFLPDFRARSPIGIGGTAVPAAGGNSYSIGQKWGDERLAAHTHTGSGSGNTGSQSANHNHNLGQYPSGSEADGYGLVGNAGFTNRVMVTGGPTLTGLENQAHTHAFSYSFTTATHNLAAQAASYGNVHPVLGINFIIKT